MVGRDGHLGEGLTLVGHHANAVKGAAVDKIHRDVFGAFKTIGAEVSGQHGGTQIHGQHHVDALSRHVFNGGCRLRPKQGHRQAQKRGRSAHRGQFHGNHGHPWVLCASLGGAHHLRRRPNKRSRLVGLDGGESQDEVYGDKGQSQPSPWSTPFHTTAEGKPCHAHHPRGDCVWQGSDKHDAPINLLHRHGFGCPTQSRCRH